MSHGHTLNVAIVQTAPVYFDKDASTEKACRLIKESGKKGAKIVVFGESWLPGYPFFTHAPPFSSIWQTSMKMYLENAIEVPGKTTDKICKAAQDACTDVVIGIAELDGQTKGTIYCTLLYISHEGKIIGRHRKLKPTFEERMVWGDGDGVGLTAFERPYGRISGLSCGEHNMVLPSYALMSQGTQIHISAWPFPDFISDGHPAKGLAMAKAFAIQGRCFVIASASLLQHSDLPDEYHTLIDGWRFAPGEGGSCVIGPDGEVIAQLNDSEDNILQVDISLDAITPFKALFDVAGHYSRPDVLQLHINRSPRRSILDINTASEQLCVLPE
ncbi:carbon-nitrogen hydrolase family protein [Gynuella sp.]|uniref:carbon-nitrogen hydrolase family protein n=1 Tax=Gynuella sp. TaxID=2969146 RepID=UPI003D0A42EA